ncbi:hypothetical protein P171DRAFT_486660 [Karstenula rhodostoma CBS 690.94]|uniref:Carboxylesterase type B domain-containing protein n=1 Tax=Karstenula rhodostoma CBS 690.94 TaxID=1392251 RepID=A0A9P4PCU9_9PLEO|nr:hypothetical protein P171DRAFT_486660 [Karstenula rhodostoma CBS 690.94]
MRSAVLFAALPALVSAHGHVEQVKAEGVLYQGWNARQYPNAKTTYPPRVFGLPGRFSHSVAAL